jgi:hypothetical protein
MTAANHFVTAEFNELWQTVMPNVDPPDHSQLTVWAAMYPPDIVEHGIRRAARKVQAMARAGTPMTPYDCFKYASSVMRNEIAGTRGPRVSDAASV